MRWTTCVGTANLRRPVTTVRQNLLVSAMERHEQSRPRSSRVRKLAFQGNIRAWPQSDVEVVRAALENAVAQQA